MPAKIGLVAQSYLEGVALPQHGSTYTVISHKFVIDTVKEELNNHGFFIEEESYRATSDGAIATGMYKLTHMEDPELSMAFAWTNSYNKMVKFKAVVGAISNVNGAFMILGDQGSWIRKHTGTADLEAKGQIIAQIKNAGVYYSQLLSDKKEMQEIVLTKRSQAKLLGLLFADYGILESTTANIVKSQMIKPGFFYNGGSDTLWAFYNHLIFSIQDSHPRTWLEEQRMSHYIITNEFGLLAPVATSAPLALDTTATEQVDIEPETDSMQLDLEEVISEIESEEITDPGDEQTSDVLEEISLTELAQDLYGVNNTNVESNFSLDIDEEEEEEDDENPEEDGEISLIEDEEEDDLGLASIEDDEEEEGDLDFL